MRRPGFRRGADRAVVLPHIHDTIRAVTKYAVVIHEDPEGGFWAEVPALPGCYSQAESVEVLMTMCVKQSLEY